MKLGKLALLEIVAIFQDGLLGIRDASEALRELDLAEEAGALELSKEYVTTHPRSGDYEEE